ncbi:hypothetical protein ACWD5V_15935 [Streptomyces sp. NPDC002523]
MRLLLRANAHRSLSDHCREVAASPDTPRREPWQWQVRLLTHGRTQTDAPGLSVHRIATKLPGGTILEVAADPATVVTAVDVVDPSSTAVMDRKEEELVVLIACGGRVLLEDRHLLSEADALVLAGDDPLRVTVRRPDGAASRVAMVRLSATGVGTLGWVP